MARGRGAGRSPSVNARPLQYQVGERGWCDAAEPASGKGQGMKTPDTVIETNEPVLWRSKTMREYVSGVLKPFGLAILGGLLLPILLGSTYGIILGLMIPAVFGLAILEALVPFPDRIALTKHHVLIRRGLRRPESRILTRKHVEILEIFEGDGWMVLHGRHGMVARVRFLGKPLDLAREMNLPTRIWHRHDPPKATGRRRAQELVSWFVYPAAILLAVFGSLVGILTAIDSRLGPDFLRTTFSKVELGFVLMAFMSVAFVSAMILGGIAMGGIRRLLMPPKELAFLRCVQTDRSWQGRMPVARP